MPWNFTWYDRVDEEGEALEGEVLESRGTTTIVDLSTPPFNVLFRTFSANAPPFRPINENVPLTPGSFLKFVDTDENEVDLVLRINASGDTPEEVKADLYNIVAGSATNGVSLPYLFNPTKQSTLITLVNPPNPVDTQRILTGDGKLRVTTPVTEDSLGNPKTVTRDLICRCITGFQIRESDLQIGTAFAPLTFYANQPYWRSESANEFNMGGPNQQPEPLPWFSWGSLAWVGDQIYLDGLRPGANNENASTFSNAEYYEKDFKIVNFGDVSTPIKWTIKGPGTGPYFENITSGKTLSFSQDLEIRDLQYLVVDTANRRVYIIGGEQDLIKYITVTSQFWELLTDSNEIRVRLDNTSSDTEITLKYYERWLGVY